jgi:hypothetical protein
MYTYITFPGHISESQQSLNSIVPRLINGEQVIASCIAEI